MTDGNRILDNHGHNVVDHLRESLWDADTFRLVSAYFSIYGYELLAEALDGVGEVRFLFGDPGSVEEVDPGEKEPKSFSLTEQGKLAPTHVLRQKALALACAGWIRSDSVGVRSISRSHFLHGKMYLTDGAAGGTAVVGSSNFTQKGLGGGRQPNLEINLATADANTCTELRGWFDKLWHDPKLTADVKQDVLNALARIGQEQAAEFIYFKTLFELFRDEIDARLDSNQRLDDIHLHDTQIWKTLYEFQRDGARSVISRLRRHNGCILADSVGLGKTYTALAVIKYFELRNERVLVLCPRKLRDNWSLYPAYTNQQGNPFAADRFGYTLLSHTDLSRDGGTSGDVNLARFNWGGFDLVVIDESHNFRNDGGQRYARLIDDIIRQGAQTKVLMLSATPVNTSLIDLRNQIYLMTEGRDDVFRESLGIGNVQTVLSTAQKQFKSWENQKGQRDKAQLLERLGADFLGLLNGVSIARSRRQIERFYAQEIERIGRFPEHEQPDNRYPDTDREGNLSYQEIAEQIGNFRLSVYRPTDYLVDETRLAELAAERQRRNFNQADRERFLIGMIRTNFMKRLESSAHALTLTLTRTVAKIDDLLQRIDQFEKAQQRDLEVVTVTPDEQDIEDDEDFVINRARHPYRLSELDLSRWRIDLGRDRETLDAALKQVAAITPGRDGKLAEIRRIIRDKAQQPTSDQDGNANRKLLVFTTFKDTAQYLYDNLGSLAAELRLNMAMVSGDVTRTTYGANDFNAILSNFAPRARNRTDNNAAPAIDLLIATDCISEGQNLQDCDTVLNYDIHWNPVRLIQRFGRIDRIGSRNKAVCMVNFWPTQDMETYLRLENRVRARMALADMAASGDEDPLSEEDAEIEMRFRDEQLLKLREEIIDLDELDDSPTLSDFTLDYFFAQLLQYLEKNRDQLEALPYGAYAVTTPAAAPAGPGVVFFLRQRNAGAKQRLRRASPVHPFYLVYIRDDGHIRFGCINTKQALDVFEAASTGRASAISSLCDRFNAETHNGRDMARYNDLLNAVVAHIAQAHRTDQTAGLGLSGSRDFMLLTVAESPTAPGDFELITWLVIMDSGQADR